MGLRCLGGTVMKINNYGRAHILISILISIPFFILWYGISLVISIASSEGILSVFKDAYGKWSIYVGIALAILAFSSIFYARFIMNKEWKIQLTAYLLTIIFCVAGILFLNIGESKFQTFSTQKWQQYPNRRPTMYDDFKKNYNINEYTIIEVEELLGKPNKIASDGTYIYSDGYGNDVFIYFKDGKVVNHLFIS